MAVGAAPVLQERARGSRNAYKSGYLETKLREANEEGNSSLQRRAIKMATGSGKTVVMAMLIAWQTLNKLANPQDKRFCDAFLIVAPGITIRDRLRVLLPNDPDNYYEKMDVVPRSQLGELHKAKIAVTNFQALQPKERNPASTLTKAILAGPAEEDSPFRETPAQVVRRVCKDLGNKRSLIVINDEAHHCYRPRVFVSSAQRPPASLTSDDRKEAKEREEEARVWITGLEWIAKGRSVRSVYDLSATPFYLRGSGYDEGKLFPWVVSDFSLIDAIECGIVKVPRVPVDDNSLESDVPTYRELWLNIRRQLPKRGRKSDELSGDLPLPKALEGALESLYGNYRKHYELWQSALEAKVAGAQHTPPVFIVVCSNTSVSKLVYDWISGYEKPLADGSTVPVPGKLELFRNVEADRVLERPNTILVDSSQLESGEAMSPPFKRIATREIEEFKRECRQRFPGRNADDLTDEDLLREVMNTVGKPGRLGEHIKCVVSVSMLTEGWDANTVTHILGVRAFSTQLLCEQVVGRALRRTSYVPDDEGMLAAEYAEVYGVPFSFIPTHGGIVEKPPEKPAIHVRALPERAASAITFPRVLGYRYDLPTTRLTPAFEKVDPYVLDTSRVPTWTKNAPIVGSETILTLDDLKERRLQEVAFKLAKLTLEKYFRQDGSERAEADSEHFYDSEVQARLFPQVLTIVRRWIDERLICKDDTFPQLLLLVSNAHDAADRIYQAIVRGEQGRKLLKPILQPFETVGSTEGVEFDTRRPCYETTEKCHLSHVVCDTTLWEQRMAKALESMPEVEAYVKNYNLGFAIPYTVEGREHEYVPDFITRTRLTDGFLLNLLIEVTGFKYPEKAAKASTATNLWVPAVNNHGGFGRWAYVEVLDITSTKATVRAAVQAAAATPEETTRLEALV